MLLLLDFQETFLPALLTFIVFEEPAVTVILELLIVGVLAAYVVDIKQEFMKTPSGATNARG